MTAIPGGLLLGGFLRVSFQRFPFPQGGVIEASPRSYGALPVAIGANGDALVPLASGEAIWIGVSVEDVGPRAVCLRVTATTDVGTRVNVQSGRDATDAASGLLVPPTSSLEGITRSAGGWFAIARVVAEGSQSPAIRTLELVAVPTRVNREPEPRRDDLPLHSLAIGPGQPRSRVAACDERTNADAWDHSRRATVTVVFVDHATFASASDLPLPEPLHHSQPYGGWRLP